MTPEPDYKLMVSHILFALEPESLQDLAIKTNDKLTALADSPEANAAEIEALSVLQKDLLEIAKL